MEGDLITMQDIFVFEKTGLTEKGRVTGASAPPVSARVFTSNCGLPVCKFPPRCSKPWWSWEYPIIMTPVIGIVIFLVLFAVLMVAVGLGSRFLELRGKKQMETILNPPPARLKRSRHPFLVAPATGSAGSASSSNARSSRVVHDPAAASRFAMGSQATCWWR